METDLRTIRKARQAYINAKTKSAVRAKDEDDSPDFTQEKPSMYVEETEPASFPDQKAWEELARRYSAAFRQYPQVEESLIFLQATRSHNYLVSTEGTKIVTADAIFRIMIQAQTRARRRHAVDAGGDFSVFRFEESAVRSGSGGERQEDGERLDRLAVGAAGRTLQWSRVVVGEGVSGFLS